MTLATLPEMFTKHDNFSTDFGFGEVKKQGFFNFLGRDVSFANQTIFFHPHAQRITVFAVM